MVEIDAFAVLPKSTKLPRTNMIRDAIRTGIVLSSKVLQKGKSRGCHQDALQLKEYKQVMGKI